jgi:hypothetical protein
MRHDNICVTVLCAAAFVIAAESRACGAEPATTVASDAIQPQLAVDDRGAIYVTFIHRGNICVAVSKDRGTSFGEPTIAMDVGGRAKGGRQRGPRIAVDSKGKLTVTAPVTFDQAEYQKKYPTAELYLVTSSDGGKSWTKPLQVNTAPKKAPEALHWMTVAASGEVHVAWLDLRSRSGRGQDIYYAKVVGGRVGENTKIATTVCECCAPGMAVDGAGNPLVAYREGGEKASREIFAIQSSNKGAAFSKAVQINRQRSLEDT